jgi:hypothetical protein
MSELICCDACSGECPRDSIGWLILDRFGLDVYGLGDAPMPVHFCGRVCAQKWLAAQDNRGLQSVGGATKDQLVKIAEHVTGWLVGLEGCRVETLWQRGMFELNTGGAWIHYEPTTGQRMTITIDGAFGVDVPVRAR